MTFAHYEFKAGSSIHEHSHQQEEVFEIVEGEVEMTIGGATQVLGAGMAAIVPAEVLHSTRAITDGRLIVVDYPLRPEFG